MKYKNNSEDDTKEIFIIITNACNLQCRYCYETNKNAPSVDVESIKIVIKNEILNNSFGFNRFLINFHGGEPFWHSPKWLKLWSGSYILSLTWI